MKILIVGCGKIARLHTKYLKAIGDCELHFFSRSLDRARAFAQSLGYPQSSAYSGSLEQILEKETWKGVWICTPPSEHLEVLLWCLKLKIKVFCEKPLVSTRADFERLSNLEPPSSLCFVGENYLYKPLLIWIKSLRDLGRVKTVNLRKCVAQRSTGWRQDESPMLEGGVHFAALALEIADLESEQNLSFTHSEDRGLYTCTALRDSDGLKLEVKYSWNRPWPLPAGLGQKSSIEFENALLIFESNGTVALLKHSDGSTKFKLFGRDVGGFGGMYLDVAKWLRSSEVPVSTLLKAKAALKFSGIDVFEN